MAESSDSSMAITWFTTRVGKTRLDRQALELKSTDRVLVITSAGCNALDYVLAGAGQVYAVDMNPRQNALLELKLSGIRNLQYEDFSRCSDMDLFRTSSESTATSFAPH